MSKKILVILVMIICSICTVQNVYADTKLHPAKIKKDYTLIEHDKEVIVRYFDVNKIDIEPREEENTFYILKDDKTKFSKEDLDKMLIYTETLNIKNKDIIKIKEFENKICIGYNLFQNKEKKYTTYQIGVTENGDNIFIDSKNTKLYLDVFYLSSKKVYVRHINASSFYDEQNNNIIGFDETQIIYAQKFEKENKVADVYDNATDNKETTIKGLAENTTFQEEYVVPINKNIEVFNILDPTKKYLGYKKIVSSNKEAVKENKNIIYDGSITRIGNLDKRVFTEKGYQDTYIDMFYRDKVMESIEDKIVGEVIEANIIPEGKVYAKATNEIFNKGLKETKLPSGEEIKLGIVDVKPYIVSDMGYIINSKVDLESNGKNYFEVPYRYAKFNNVNIFTIKDSVSIMDKDKKLLEKEEKINIPLKEEYINKANNIKHIPYKINKNYIEEYTHPGCEYCKKTYLEIEVASDYLTFENEKITDPLEVKTKKYLIKEEKCKEFNGQRIKDERKTKYYTPKIETVQKEEFEENLINQVEKAKNPNKEQDVDKLYKDNNYIIPQIKENGEYDLFGTLEYENKYKIGKLNSQVQKVNLVMKDKQVSPVIVYTPVIVNAKLNRIGGIINHTNQETKDDLITKNTPFVITPITNGIQHQIYTKINDYEKYIREYLISFNFDLDYYKVYNRDGTIKEDVNKVTKKDTKIFIPVGGKIEAKAVSNYENIETNGLKSGENKYTLSAIAVNAPNVESYYKDLVENKNKLSDDIFNKNTNSHKIYHNKDITEEKNYVAKRVMDINSIDRIYDFRIVDLKDHDYYSIFRKDKTKDLTGNFYYAGNRRVNLREFGINELYNSNSYTLPLGPYKHNDPLYKFAPKIGTSFDFDLKTTGAFANSTSKCIKIKPEFYFVSKDGNNIKTQEQIDIYYSLDKDKIIKLGSSQDTYKINMKPVDYEKYLKDFNSEFTDKYLSKNEITIGTSSEIILNASSNMVKTTKDQEQIWVGRYKLPNSLFVVNKGEKNLNNKLKDGYLGVVFNMYCLEKTGPKTICTYYSKNNKNESSLNTSQWDMEGNLGANYGTENNISLKLENGNLNINNELYSKIKGTVMLFDLDKKSQE